MNAKNGVNWAWNDPLKAIMILMHVATPSDVRFQLGGGVLTVTITATAGTVSEAQQIQVSPRSR